MWTFCLHTNGTNTLNIGRSKINFCELFKSHQNSIWFCLFSIKVNEVVVDRIGTTTTTVTFLCLQLSQESKTTSGHVLALFLPANQRWSFLDLTRGSYPWCWPKGSQPLGTRLNGYKNAPSLRLRIFRNWPELHSRPQTSSRASRLDGSGKLPLIVAKIWL